MNAKSTLKISWYTLLVYANEQENVDDFLVFFLRELACNHFCGK